MPNNPMHPHDAAWLDQHLEAKANNYQKEKVQLITYTSQLERKVRDLTEMNEFLKKSVHDADVFYKYKTLEAKVQKLKALILLVDPAVADVEVGSTQITQWSEFVKCFPEENSDEKQL